MRKIIFALFLASGLAGCAGLQTIGSASIPPGDAAAAINLFNTAEATGTAYLQLPACVTGGAVVCRSQNIAAAIAPALNVGATARKSLYKALKSANGGAVALASYQTLTGAISTLNAVYSQYGVSPKGN